MKKILTILILFIGFIAHAQLGAVTDNNANNNYAQRLTIVNDSEDVKDLDIDFYGIAGLRAVDLSEQTLYQNGLITVTAVNGQTEEQTLADRLQGKGATGDNSVAMGKNTWAQGKASTAMGEGTVAADYGSLAIGHYNVPTQHTADGVNPLNILFSIGNGANSSNPSNAFSVAQSGNTYIKTLYLDNAPVTASATELNLLDGLITPIGSGVLERVSHDTPANGVRLFSLNHVAQGQFSVDLSAQTASGQALDGSDGGTSGDHSVAMGKNTLAAGHQSTAMGLKTKAIGLQAIAMGNLTKATGVNSTAMGISTHALGLNSTAMGNGAKAYDDNSLAIGMSNGMTQASSGTKTAFVIGDGSKSVFKVLFDGNTTMEGDATIVGDATIGTNLALTGDASNATITNTSAAAGDLTISNAAGSTADGNLTISNAAATGDLTISNTATTSGNLTIDNATTGNIAITTTVGDITLTATPVNAGTATGEIELDGIVRMTDNLTVAGDVVVNSDMRLKANIISLGSTLYKLLQIDGKTYTMKRDATKKQKIGVLAQDIEKVFPELVVESNGIKSVNYQGLVPVLINSIKEQDAKISRLEKLVEKLISNK